MILLRLRYRPVTVPLQFIVPRYGPLPFFLKGYIPLRTVTQSLHALPNVTCVTERYKRYKRYRALHTKFMNSRKFK